MEIEEEEHLHCNDKDACEGVRLRTLENRRKARVFVGPNTPNQSVTGKEQKGSN